MRSLCRRETVASLTYSRPLSGPATTPRQLAPPASAILDADDTSMCAAPRCIAARDGGHLQGHVAALRRPRVDGLPRRHAGHRVEQARRGPERAHQDQPALAHPALLHGLRLHGAPPHLVELVRPDGVHEAREPQEVLEGALLEARTPHCGLPERAHRRARAHRARRPVQPRHGRDGGGSKRDRGHLPRQDPVARRETPEPQVRCLRPEISGHVHLHGPHHEAVAGLTAGASGTRASSTSNTTARTTSSWATRRTSGATCASRRRRAASPTTSACATST